MYIENRGQHPRLNKFYLITTLLDISVDQFFFPCNEDGDNKDVYKRQLQYALPYLMLYLLGTYPSMLTTGLNPFINAQGYRCV